MRMQKEFPFAVVAFIDEDTEETVPTNWLEDEHNCWFPPKGANVTHLIKTMAPVDDTFKLHRCAIVFASSELSDIHCPSSFFAQHIFNNAHVLMNNMHMRAVCVP